MAAAATTPHAGRERWAVIGGGMLGLTLAHRLAQRGMDVTLMEAAGQLGGLAGAWSLDGVVWDRHYHVTLLSDGHLCRLLAELGLAEEMEWRETRTGCYAAGRLHSVSSALELLRFPVLGPVDKLRLAATIFYASKIRDGRRLEDIPVADWLARWSGRRTFERFWRPLLRSKLGESYRETSAAFIWTTIARLYAARRSGLEKEMFGYVQGGYARILARFAEVLAAEGVRIELGCRVERVEQTVPGAGGGLEIHRPGAGPERFDRVAVTVAAPLAARLCPELTAAERDRLQAIRYQGIVCASLLLRRPLAGYYLTYLLDDGLPFTGVIEMSALVDRRHLGGRALVYLPRYLAPDDPFFSLSDAEVEAQFLAGLTRLYPDFTREDVLCFRVSRVPEVLALPTLGYSRGLPPMTTSVPGLSVISSAHIVNGTLNVNETVRLADEAFGAIAGAVAGRNA